MLTHETTAIVVQQCSLLGLWCEAEQHTPTTGIDVKALMGAPVWDFLHQGETDQNSREQSQIQSVELQTRSPGEPLVQGARVKEENPEEKGTLPGKSPALLKMWKDLGQSLPIAFYRGEDNPDVLLAWRKGVEQYIELYDVPADSQVLAATTFLQDSALKWWLMLTSTGQYR